MEPELGVALGYYTVNGKKIGHAFNVGMVNGVLWYFDATSKKKGKYNKVTSGYYIHYIITENNFYCVDGSKKFGKEVIYHEKKS